MRDVEFHPAIKSFPDSGDEAYAKLLADIRARSQRRPIALFEGKIWDGRCRYYACQELKLEPKYRILKRKNEPVSYLILREKHLRFGGPRTPERDAALAVLHRIYDDDHIAAFKRRRSEWLAKARNEFRLRIGRPEPCAVCGKHIEFVHAHHTLPLNVQFELGLDDFDIDHTHDWLCPVHHRYVHMMISVWITDTRDGEWLDRIHDDDVKEWNAVELVFNKSMALFKSYGGVNGNGRAQDYAESE
jgi:hypothetical protein